MENLGSIERGFLTKTVPITARAVVRLSPVLKTVVPSAMTPTSLESLQPTRVDC